MSPLLVFYSFYRGGCVDFFSFGEGFIYFYEMKAWLPVERSSIIMIPFILHCQLTSKKHSKGHSMNIRDHQVWDHYLTKVSYIKLLLFAFSVRVRAYYYVIIVYSTDAYNYNYFHISSSTAEVFIFHLLFYSLYSPVTYT